MSAHWDPVARDWDTIQGEFGDVYRVSLLHPTVLDFLSVYFGGLPGKLLDVGSGNGAFARYMARNGWSVVGVENSGLLVNLARAYSASATYSGSLLYVHRDAVETTGLGFFDAVTCLFSHQDMGSLESIFAVARAVLRPGGLLVLVGEDLTATGSVALHSLSSRSWEDEAGVRRRQRIWWGAGSAKGDRSEEKSIVTTLFELSEYSQAATSARFLTLDGPRILPGNGQLPRNYEVHPRFLLHVSSPYFGSSDA